MRSVLFVVSAADRWTLKDGNVHPTGYWVSEISHPWKVFGDAGWKMDVATPDGKVPTPDKKSEGGILPGKKKELEEFEEKPEMKHPKNLSEINGDEYDIIFYPGGHAPLEDLAYDKVSGKLITDRINSGKMLGLVCHGPAALLAAENEDGSWPFKGFTLTGFSNAEEKVNKFAKEAPWLLESELEKKGADYKKGHIPFVPYVISDRNLYTGQNPASAESLAKKMLEDFEKEHGK